MIDNLHDLLIILLQSSLILAILYFIYRPYIYSIFDPLFFFLITQAFSIELGILQISYLPYLLNFLSCISCFTIAFLFFLRKYKKTTVINDEIFEITNPEIKFLSVFTISSFIIILIANIYLISQKGLILLSSDPSMLKIAAYDGTGGLGAVRRINWGLLHLDALLSFFLYIRLKKNRYLIIFILLLLISISGGTKGAILTFLFIISLSGTLNSFRKNNYYQRFKKLQLPILLIGLVISIFIISANFYNLTDSILSLGLRFLYFGDAILYYYTPETVRHFQQLNILDYFKYEFNTTLGFFRIVPYTVPLGFELVSYSFTHNESLENVFGPNMPYYVKGHIYFGAVGAFFYSFTIGAIFGFLRSKLFAQNKKATKYLYILLLVFLNIEMLALPQDSAFFLTILFDTFLFSLLPFLLSYLALLLLNFNEKIN